MRDLAPGIRASTFSIFVNIFLAAVKIVTGVVGNSYALIADGVESCTDILSSLVVWGGLRIAARPPDRTHPYGHGKAESLAALFVSLVLLAAAVGIAIQSIREILVPHHAPAWYTLVVLGIIIGIKECMFRFILQIGKNLQSNALKSDAWHHRADAITSLTAFIGISVALVGGNGYESADDWAALIGCAFIFYNGVRLLAPALDEVMDAAASPTTEAEVRKIASSVEGVARVEKCRVRKSGIGLQMDLHVQVDRHLSVERGHEISHLVKDRLTASPLVINDVIIHIEPHIPSPPSPS